MLKISSPPSLVQSTIKIQPTKTLSHLLPLTGNSEGELTVSAGEELVIVEDDGGGWTLVARGAEEGYVPTSYVENL